MPEKKMQTILALLVFLALWLNGKFYPLLLMPLVFVKFYCRESLSRIGLSSKNLRLSLLLGASSSLIAIMAYYPIFIGYLGKRIVDALDISVIFMDLVWYPVFEELSYRGFFLGFSPGKIPSMVPTSSSTSYRRSCSSLCTSTMS